jgi:hypothetical protein
LGGYPTNEAPLLASTAFKRRDQSLHHEDALVETCGAKNNPTIFRPTFFDRLNLAKITLPEPHAKDETNPLNTKIHKPKHVGRKTIQPSFDQHFSTA